MAALGMEVQPALRSRENAHPPVGFYGPSMDVAYVTSAHSPLAVLSHVAPTHHKGRWETLSSCGPRVKGIDKEDG